MRPPDTPVDEIKQPERNEIKKKTLYLLKKHTCAANGEIAEIIGMTSAAVAKAYQRFVRQLECDPSVKDEMRTLEAELSRVKG